MKLKEILIKANELQAAGRTKEAEELILSIIQDNSNSIEGYYHLGVLYFKSGRNEEALKCLEECIKGGLRNSSVFNYAGLILQNKGEIYRSAECFESALEIEPGNVQTLNNAAFSYHLMGEESKALEKLKMAITFDPQDQESYYNLAYVYQSMGQLENAEKFYLDVLKLNPEHFKALWNLGEINLKLQKADKAVRPLKKLLEFNPENDEVRFNLATAYELKEQFEEAVIIYEDLISKKLFKEKPLFNLANIQRTLGNYESAVNLYKRAAELNEDKCEIWNNLGLLYIRLFKYDEAEKSLLTALKIKPYYKDALINLAALYYEMELPEKTIEVLTSSLEIFGDDDEMRFNRSLALLVKGNIKEGFKEYEYRKSKSENDRKYKKTWKGENLKGKTLIVVDEQGIGDAIQFVRYFKPLKETGAYVVFHCRSGLQNLFNGFKWVDKTAPLDEDFADYDYSVSLLSLPHLLSLTGNDYLLEIPYLSPPKVTGAKLKDENKIKIGFVWKGNPDHKYDYKRSVDLGLFCRLFSFNEVDFYSLQVTADEEELKLLNRYGIESPINGCTDFSETVKFLEEMDLVITVDTAVAHIAGAMGKAVWTLLPFGPDWRWGLRSKYTEWYPSMRLIRQSVPGSWEEVFYEVEKELKNFLTKDSQGDIRELKLLALENHQKGNFNEAEQHYKEILLQDPDDEEIIFWLASLYLEKNKFTEAEDFFLKLMKLNPGYNPDLYINLARIYSVENKNRRALEILKKGTDNIPGSPQLYTIYGYYLAEEGDNDEALNCFKKALELNPGFREALINKALLYEQAGKLSTAIEEYRKALYYFPDDSLIFEKIGNCYLKIKDFPGAEKYYRSALNEQRENHDLLNNLGFVLQRQNKLNEADEYFLKALELKESAGFYYNLANNKYLQNYFPEAEKFYQKALELNPDYREAKTGLAFIYLGTGNFKEGWKYFSYSLTEHPILSQTGIKKWKGESLKGKTILIYEEQGLGDTIHFSRYLIKVRDEGAHVKFVCHSGLLKIFKEVPGISMLSEIKKDDLPDVDYYASLLNLPGQLAKLDINDNSNVNLINDQLTLSCNHESLLSKDKMNVGFVWKGNSSHQNDLNRSVELKEFSRLFKLNHINFLSFQYDVADELVPYLNNYNNLKQVKLELPELVGLINKLDIVITVDTFAAHLAGTMGKKVWILLPFAADWRWMKDTDTSYLYPSARLFRQNRPGNWESVFDKILNELLPVTQHQTIATDEQSMILSARQTFEQGDPNKAVLILNQTLEKYQRSTEAYMFLGYIYQVNGKLSMALEAYLKVVGIDPVNYHAYSNLGVILKDLKKFDEAEKALILSLKINDKNAVAYNNLAIINHLKGEFEKGFENLQKALKINPNYVEVLINLSNYYDYINDFRQALNRIDSAIESDPKNPDARFNKSLILLKENYCREALLEYEWRKKKPDYQARMFSRPELNTLQIKGKTILVYDEQGFGDTIQFARYLRFLKERGAKVILECHQFLVELMKNCEGVDEVYPREYVEKNKIDYDYQIALLSLPLYFIDEYPAIPGKVPYIKIDETSGNNWHESYIKSDGYNIGIVWRGKQPVSNLQRSTRLEFFEDIAKIKSVRLFSLQKEETTEEEISFMKKHGIVDLSAELTDFKKTAQIMKKLDLVVTIDTSVAHLAGALAVRTFTMLSKRADWRWYRDTEENPWYPTMKIFRQEIYNNWKTIFNKITTEINSEINKNP